jgi:formylglycine-generating enzyme required for sulfatase activity/energy-coupling factor transporter ATP-binding protein EcfA2
MTDDRDAYIQELEAQLRELRAAKQRAQTPSVHQEIVATGGGQINNSYIVNGDNNIFHPDPSAAPRERALHRYLHDLRAECSPLQLDRVDAGETRNRAAMRLEQVYISMNVDRQIDAHDPANGQDSREERSAPVSVIEALQQAPHGRMLLLGAPGSGKSTLVNHLAFALAEDSLSRLPPNATSLAGFGLNRLPGWTLGERIPVRVLLRDLVAFSTPSEALREPLKWMHAYLQQKLSIDLNVPNLLHDVLLDGKGLLLLDGFDEVTEPRAVESVVALIQRLVQHYDACPIVVTCRLRDYRDNPARYLAGFAIEALAPLTNAQISRFVDRWYEETNASGRSTLGKASSLQRALNHRSELREMARLPLLLTMTTIVHAGKGELPTARALLYDACVRLLLLRWREEHGDVLEQLDLSHTSFGENDLLRVTARLGYEAQVGNVAPLGLHAPADLDGDAVRRVLRAEFSAFAGTDPIRLDTLVSITMHAIATRNGLLLKQSGEGGERFSFPHRSFQEFLAGYYLKTLPNARRQLADLARQAHWHETLLLMVGYQAMGENEVERPLDLARELLRGDALQQTLAGEILQLVSAERARLNGFAEECTHSGLWGETCTKLRAIADGVSAASLRVRAARTLGQLEYGKGYDDIYGLELMDRRLPLSFVGTLLQDVAAWRDFLAESWCLVPAGSFWYGDDRHEPLALIEIPYSYQIGRYPVTNVEYARFVASGGYDRTKPWWAMREGAWVLRDDRQAPYYWDTLPNSSPLQPVVGVSWYEAAAYAAWLTHEGHRLGWLPDAMMIRLPTWLEWQKAARGSDRRRYPWGDAPPAAELANFKETRVGMAAPIGCFHAGQSEYGAHDMVGNVMEWTATPQAAPAQLEPRADFVRDEPVVLSFSEWSDSAEDLCCGAREWSDPSIWMSNRSFRLVLVDMRSVPTA